jgi:hypothetical protein
MAYLGQTFNASEHEAWGERKKIEPVPRGRYLSQIIASEIVQTRAGNGQRLAFTLDILDGQYAGRKLFDGINLVNPSKAAVEVGRSRLAMICNALEVHVLDDSSDLHLRPFWAHVEIKADRNEISFYEKRERVGGSARPVGSPAGISTGPSVGNPVVAPAPAKKPWERA